jgi:phosphopantothenoylcysteine synthetase/decarboxylase
VYLTDDGRDVLASTAPARSDAIVAIMAELSGEQRERLARLCRRLLRVLDPDQANEPTADAHDDATDDAHDDAHDEHDDVSDDEPDTPAVDTTLPSPT